MDKEVSLLENDTAVKSQAPDLLNERFSDFDISFGSDNDSTFDSDEDYETWDQVVDKGKDIFSGDSTLEQSDYYNESRESHDEDYEAWDIVPEEVVNTPSIEPQPEQSNTQNESQEQVQVTNLLQESKDKEKIHSNPQKCYVKLQRLSIAPVRVLQTNSPIKSQQCDKRSSVKLKTKRQPLCGDSWLRRSARYQERALDWLLGVGDLKLDSKTEQKVDDDSRKSNTIEINETHRENNDGENETQPSNDNLQSTCSSSWLRRSARYQERALERALAAANENNNSGAKEGCDESAANNVEKIGEVREENNTETEKGENSKSQKDREQGNICESTKSKNRKCNNKMKTSIRNKGKENKSSVKGNTCAEKGKKERDESTANNAKKTDKVRLENNTEIGKSRKSRIEQEQGTTSERMRCNNRKCSNKMGTSVCEKRKDNKSCVKATVSPKKGDEECNESTVNIVDNMDDSRQGKNTEATKIQTGKIVKRRTTSEQTGYRSRKSETKMGISIQKNRKENDCSVICSGKGDGNQMKEKGKGMTSLKVTLECLQISKGQKIVANSSKSDKCKEIRLTSQSGKTPVVLNGKSPSSTNSQLVLDLLASGKAHCAQPIVKLKRISLDCLQEERKIKQSCKEKTCDKNSTGSSEDFNQASPESLPQSTVQEQEVVVNNIKDVNSLQISNESDMRMIGKEEQKCKQLDRSVKEGSLLSNSETSAKERDTQLCSAPTNIFDVFAGVTIKKSQPDNQVEEKNLQEIRGNFPNGACIQNMFNKLKNMSFSTKTPKQMLQNKDEDVENTHENSEKEESETIRESQVNITDSERKKTFHGEESTDANATERSSTDLIHKTDGTTENTDSEVDTDNPEVPSVHQKKHFESGEIQSSLKSTAKYSFEGMNLNVPKSIIQGAHVSTKRKHSEGHSESFLPKRPKPMKNFGRRKYVYNLSNSYSKRLAAYKRERDKRACIEIRRKKQPPNFQNRTLLKTYSNEKLVAVCKPNFQHKEIAESNLIKIANTSETVVLKDNSKLTDESQQKGDTCDDGGKNDEILERNPQGNLSEGTANTREIDRGCQSIGDSCDPKSPIPFVSIADGIPKLSCSCDSTHMSELCSLCRNSENGSNVHLLCESDHKDGGSRSSLEVGKEIEAPQENTSVGLLSELTVNANLAALSAVHTNATVVKIEPHDNYTAENFGYPVHESCNHIATVIKEEPIDGETSSCPVLSSSQTSLLVDTERDPANESFTPVNIGIVKTEPIDSYHYTTRSNVSSAVPNYNAETTSVEIKKEPLDSVQPMSETIGQTTPVKIKEELVDPTDDLFNQFLGVTPSPFVIGEVRTQSISSSRRMSGATSPLFNWDQTYNAKETCQGNPVIYNGLLFLHDDCPTSGAEDSDEDDHFTGNQSGFNGKYIKVAPNDDNENGASTEKERCRVLVSFLDERGVRQCSIKSRHHKHTFVDLDCQGNHESEESNTEMYQEDQKRKIANNCGKNKVRKAKIEELVGSRSPKSFFTSNHCNQDPADLMIDRYKGNPDAIKLMKTLLAETDSRLEKFSFQPSENGNMFLMNLRTKINNFSVTHSNARTPPGQTLSLKNDDQMTESSSGVDSDIDIDDNDDDSDWQPEENSSDEIYCEDENQNRIDSVGGIDHSDTADDAKGVDENAHYEKTPPSPHIYIFEDDSDADHFSTNYTLAHCDNKNSEASDTSKIQLTVQIPGVGSFPSEALLEDVSPEKGNLPEILGTWGMLSYLIQILHNYASPHMPEPKLDPKKVQNKRKRRVNKSKRTLNLSTGRTSSEVTRLSRDITYSDGLWTPKIYTGEMDSHHRSPKIHFHRNIESELVTPKNAADSSSPVTDNQKAHDNENQDVNYVEVWLDPDQIDDVGATVDAECETTHLRPELSSVESNYKKKKVKKTKLPPQTKRNKFGSKGGAFWKSMAAYSQYRNQFSTGKTFSHQRERNNSSMSINSNEEESERKAELHNRLEKKRRDSLKNDLDQLRRVLPDFNGRDNVPKICILTDAQNRIKSLEAEGKRLTQELEYQRSVFSALHLKLSKLKEERMFVDPFSHKGQINEENVVFPFPTEPSGLQHWSNDPHLFK